MQEAARMPPQPQSTSSHDAVSPSDGDVANSAPPPKKPRSSLFASYTKKTASALVALQPVPLRCTLQAYRAYIEAASASQNASVKTVINNDQFKCLRPFISVLCASYLGPRGAHLYSLAMVEFSCALTGHLCNLAFSKCNAHL